MPEYEPAWFHHVIANAVEQMIHGPLRRLIVSMPPRHGKSELISRRLPAYLLGLNPDESIIASSYSAALASRNNRDVQRIIDSQLYANLFPDTKLNSQNTRTVAGSYLRNSDLFEIVRHEGIYRSAGVGGGITGMGGKWIIIDDPVKNREEADSATYRQSTWDWYTSTMYTRQAPDARILLVMTRWHADDLAGRLIQLSQTNPAADQWDVINFPAIAGHNPGAFDQRQTGEALWPEVFPLSELQRMRSSIGDYQFSALYQQTPRAGGGTEWPDEYFPREMWFDEWPNTITLRTIAVDPSKGRDGKQGDYSAIVLLGRDGDGTLYCQADLARRSSEAIIDATLETQAGFRADAVAVEANQFQELLAVQIASRAREMGLPIPIVPIVNTVSKLTRIRRLGPYLGQHCLRFKSNCPSTKLLVDQLRDFPTAQHDDGPDALEMALRDMIDLHHGRVGMPQPAARRLRV
jgi:predicted phage terminase large subunit-like protein